MGLLPGPELQPTPGAAGGIWGSHLEPEQRLDAPPRLPGSVYLYPLHPCLSGSLSSPRARGTSVHPPIQFHALPLPTEDCPQRWGKLPSSLC